MFRVIDGRDTGKTKTLLNECSKTGGVFICKHPYKVVDKCYSYDIDSSGILSLGYDDALKYLKKETDKNVYIDEIEEFVNFIIGDNNLKGYSLTNE